jgi:hypothetical protein
MVNGKFKRCWMYKKENCANGSRGKELPKGPRKATSPRITKKRGIRKPRATRSWPSLRQETMAGWEEEGSRESEQDASEIPPYAPSQSIECSEERKGLTGKQLLLASK